jgi:8-oxo-dGTP pyrophosphatase MutT (NUDIX family)
MRPHPNLPLSGHAHRIHSARRRTAHIHARRRITIKDQPAGRKRCVRRAITPPGSPRRFDARFFLADAADIDGPLEDFSGAEDELSHLHWVSLDETRTLDLPFITEIVLAELRALLAGHEQPGVPFFDNSGPVPTFRRIS